MRKVGLFGFCLLVLLASVVLSAPATGSNSSVRRASRCPRLRVARRPTRGRARSCPARTQRAAASTSSPRPTSMGRDHRPARDVRHRGREVRVLDHLGRRQLVDEILTVVDPTGHVVGSSDGGSNIEKVVAHDLSPGTYTVLACTFLSVLPTDYTGQLVVTTTARANEAVAALGACERLRLLRGRPRRQPARPVRAAASDRQVRPHLRLWPHGLLELLRLRVGLDRPWRPVPPTGDASTRPAGGGRRR